MTSWSVVTQVADSWSPNSTTTITWAAIPLGQNGWSAYSPANPPIRQRLTLEDAPEFMLLLENNIDAFLVENPSWGEETNASQIWTAAA